MYQKLTILVALLLSATVPSIAQTHVRKTNLPHVYIETYDQVPIASKDTYVYATMYYVDEEDVVTQYDSMEIRGRGNSTWNLAKKPYKIKFHQKEKLLGKGYAKAKKWTLLANAADKTLMRNAVTSLMGDFLGMKNSPAHRFVDVTLNGTYIGNYQISDQVEVRAHRVNIAEQEYPLMDDSNITGGYLLEVDGFKDGNIFTTTRYEVPINIHYPEADEIDGSQRSYIVDYVNAFESALSSDDFADAKLGYRGWVDSVSLANWYIATEVSGNVDGFWSTYFYKDQDDPKLYWGPLWDYDIAYNNDNRTDRGGSNNTEQQLMTEVGYGKAKLWTSRMWEDPWFGRLVNRRYAEAIGAGLETYLYQQIDSLAELLQESQELNYAKWGISRRMLRERVLYSSYDQYVTDLKEYIGTHTAHLQTAFANKKVAEPTPPFVADNVYYTITNVNTGTAISMLETSDPLIGSWQVNDAPSQQWQIIPVDGYFMLINRAAHVALNDPTPGTSTATTNTGTQLNFVTPDVTDDRQLWTLTPQGSAGYYNLTNKHTAHTANLEGGRAGNGTPIISYTTDARNASSVNRLWYIIPGDAVEDEDPEVPDAIAEVEPNEYALAYNPGTKTLHFASETPEQLSFAVRVCSLNGMPVRSFRASDICSVADLPRGIYIIMWNAGGKTRSAKLRLP